MKNLLFLLLVPIFCVAQSEQIASFTAGAGGGDFTNQPVGCQSEFSKAQTLYYPNEMQFRGAITEIRYTTSFDNISLANSNIWTVKIGTTTLAEFGATVPFVDSNTLTTVFSGAITQTRAEVIISFTQPFFYNGTDNLVIEVSETAPGFTSSLISAFKGVENFGNAPLRSKESFSGTTGGGVVNENSYPTTQFIGTLERCIIPAYSGIQAAPSQTKATIVIENNQAVTGYNYVVYEKGITMPANLIPTVQNSIELTNLLPAQEYIFAAKTNCDTPINRFVYIGFSTKPSAISVPHTINFDGVNTRDYIFSGGYIANASISNKAGNNSANGILFRGALDAIQANTWSDFDVWNTNTNFISQANFIIDLTNNPTNPIFTFDLKQKDENYFRVRINNVVKTWTFKSSPGGDVNFQKITIDLSEFIGQTINLDLQSLSKYTGDIGIRTAFVDNIELKSATCLAKENDFLTTSTENSITLQATDLSSNYEVAIVNQASDLTDDSWTTVSLPYTFNDLTIAKAYKIFVRKVCGNENSAFIELFESTKTTIITVPFSEAFNAGDFTTYFVPKYNNSSNVTINTVYHYVNLHQRENGKTWFGDLNTTDSQAWNENKNFVSTLNFRVNATNLASLTMTLNYKLARFYAANSSWFRIMINGKQFMPSQVPNSLNADPFTTTNFDLSDFVGGIINIELQHSGRRTTFTSNGINDAAYVSLIEFSGTLGNDDFSKNHINIYPNPFSNSITVETEIPFNSIEMYDVLGKKIDASQTANTINTSALNNGIYFLKLKKADGQEFVRKVIKN